MKIAALTAVLAAFLIAPASASAAQNSDPMRTLGGDSPLCTNSPAGLDQQARADCRATGALEHPYPLDRYRFDWHIDTGITNDPTNNLLAAIQWLLAMAWLALLYLLKGVLLAFQWAFSLDPLSEAMQPTSKALTQLHTRTLGQPWMLAAISVLGLWGIWRGIVQRRTVETVAGLAAAIVMMAGALYVIARPADTIGRVSQGANDVSLGFLSGVAEGTLRQPSRTVADSSRGIFNTVILRPWCAINFADVTWCLSKAPGDRLTRAERWLRFEPDSRARNAEWQVIDDPDSEPWTNQPDVLGIDIPGTDRLEKDDQKIKQQLAGYRPTTADKQRIQIQGKSQTVIRVALFLLIAAGITGCILLIGWLSLNVLYQGLLTLILLLAAPGMLLAPAFGYHGRRLFGTWARKLLAAAIAKAIYALLLAIVLAINTIITSLDTELPWLAVWLLSAVFWWGTFLKRGELLGWLSLGAQRTPDTEKAGAQGRLTGPVTSALATAAGAPAAATLALKATSAYRTEDHREGVKAAATDELRGRATERLDHRYEDLHGQLAEHDQAREKTQGLTRRITSLDRQIEQAQNAARNARIDKDRAAAEKRQAAAKAERSKLISQRKHLESKLLSRPEEGVARRFIETADRNQIETGARYTPRQLDLQIAELRTDAEHPSGDDRHRWRTSSWKPGLPESQLEKLTPEHRRQLSAHISDQLDRDRALLAAIPDPERPAGAPSRKQTRKASRQIDTRSLKDHTRRARDQRREPAPPPAHHR